jgi:hypothetical protein
MPKADFEKLLLEAVDAGLTPLGESSKQAIYFHLERNYNIKKQEIPHRIEDFVYALKKIFGLGASFLESLFLKLLFEKAGLNAKDGSFKNLTFAETLVAVKLILER